MPFRLATLKLFGQSLSGNKKIAPKHNASKQFLVPVAGVEPARVISPTDFESASSANSNTPAYLYEHPATHAPEETGGMLMKLEPLYQKSNKFATPFPELGKSDATHFEGERPTGSQRN